MSIKESGQFCADAVAKGFAVHDFAFQVGFGGFDDGAHLLHGVGAGFRHGFGDGGVHFGIAGAGGEIGLEDGEFLGFLVDQILAAALAELIDGFFALLDERLQDLNGLRFVERVDFLGFFVLDGGFYASEDAQTEFVFRAHGVDQVLLDFFGESHTKQYSKKGKGFYTECTENAECTEKRPRI